MPGRAQHPSDTMRDHARDVAHIQAMKDMIDRLGTEIADRRLMRAQARRELRRIEARHARVA